ncbi:MAG: YggS family pyridoxal phosphate-dependent enzyme [Candidatus Omnitrophica bacterium]|nr:YggS family pyridoxal phosphate-dependent enzyme [Candidatus Omnitrophota bacterium]
MIEENLDEIKHKIESSAIRSGRTLQDIMLICVTKYSDVDQIKTIVDLGQINLGENRIKDALEKVKQLKNDICWHMIGHLQTNKAKDAVSFSEWIHSVDSVKIANAIDKEAKKIGKVQKILIEVNVAKEASKHGFLVDDLARSFDEIVKLKNIEIKGFMTIAPVCSPEQTRPFFKELRQLKEKFSVEHLSMGMSQDYEVAIEEGATMVRVGSAIFR